MMPATLMFLVLVIVFALPLVQDTFWVCIRPMDIKIRTKNFSPCANTTSMKLNAGLAVSYTGVEPLEHRAAIRDLVLRLNDVVAVGAYTRL